MSASAGSSAVSIFPEFRGFRSKVTAEVDTAANESGNRFSKAFGNGVKGIGSFVGKSLLAGGAIAGAVGAISIKGGISKALQIEDATAKMKGLGNSTGTVTTVMANALAAVKGTAFGMGDAANVASTALASGIKPGAEMSKYLTLVADAASTAQVPLGEMGQIMGKVTNSGKVTNDVLNQFGDRGVGVLQMLAKHYGVTASEMTSMVSKGKVDAATFNKVLTENIGGAAKKSGDTTRGSFANMKSAMANFGMALTSGFMPLVKPVFNQIQLIFEGLTTRLKPFAAAFATTFQGKAGPVIAGFAKNFLSNVDKMVGSVRAFVLAFQAGGDDITSSGFNGKLERVGLITRSVFDEMRGGIMAFRAAWAANDGDVTSSGFPGFMERTAFVVHQLVDAFGKLDFTSVQGFFASIGPAAGQAGGAFASIGASLTALGPAFTAFGEQLPKISAAFAAVGGVALTTLVNGLGFLADNVDTIIAWMPAIVAGFIAWRIATVAMGGAMFSLQAAQVAMAPVNLANNILRVTAIRLEQQHAAATGANTVAQNTSRLAFIRTGAALAVSKAAQIAGAAATGVATAAQWAWNAAMSANPIGIVVLAIAALVAGVVLAYNNIGWFKDGVNAAWSFISSVTMSVLGGVGSFFTGLWSGILSVAGSILGRIGGFFSSTWNNVINGVSGFIGGFVGFFRDLPGKAVAAISGLAGQMLTVGQNIVQGLIDGAKGMIDRAVQAVKDIGGSMLKGIQDFLGIHSPSREFMKIGGWVTVGLADGVKKKAPAAVKAIRDVAQRLTDAATAHWKKAASAKGAPKELEILQASELDRAAASVRAQLGTLSKLTKQRDALSAQLAASQKKLSAAVTTRNQQSADSAGALSGEFKLSDLVGRSSTAIRTVATGVASRIRAFGAKIATLRKLGLHPSLIAEIGALGSREGSSVADALIRGGGGDISGINSAFKDIGKFSAQAGGQIADGMYANGINGLKGLVNGFSGDLRAVDQAAKKVTDRLTAQVKKNLGIRSPSRVMRFQVGQMAGKGVALGVEDMIPRIQAASERMAAIPAAVAAQPRYGALADSSGSYKAGQAGSAGPGSPIHFTINQVDDPIGTTHAVARRLTARFV